MSFGQYELREPISGAGGEHYRAFNTLTQRDVILTLWPAERTADFAERFDRESRGLTALRHPNILPLNNFGDVDGRLYRESDPVIGTDLHHAAGGLPVMDHRRAVHIVGQIASALDAAHSTGIVHGDLTPASVLIDGRDHVYLTGFTAGDVPPGDPQIDVYALALLLRHLVAPTGIPPALDEVIARGTARGFARATELAGAAGAALGTARGPARGAVAALVAGLIVLAATMSVAVWQGISLFAEKRTAHTAAAADDDDRAEAMTAAKDAAVGLTTVNWQTIDQDVQRILDNSTGTFHDDFASRKTEYAAVVKEAKTTSVGTVSQAAVEKIGDDDATVLVALQSTSSTPDQPRQDPRQWRMRITLDRVDERYLASDVEFVP